MVSEKMLTEAIEEGSETAHITLKPKDHVSDVEEHVSYSIGRDTTGRRVQKGLGCCGESTEAMVKRVAAVEAEATSQHKVSIVKFTVLFCLCIFQSRCYLLCFVICNRG